jgi:hypothetical protein
MLSLPAETVLYAGTRRTIVFARTAAGRMPVKDFLETQDVSDAEYRRFEHLVGLLGDTGRITNASHFKKLGGRELWEFRVGSLRVLAWQAGACCLLLRAARKQAWKLRRSDLDAAAALARQNIERMTRSS